MNPLKKCDLALVVGLVFLVGTSAAADLNLHCIEMPKRVTVIFPDGTMQKARVGNKEIKNYFKRNRIPDSLYHSAHKIDTYVYTAFFMLGLEFDGKIEHVQLTNRYSPTKKAWITKIGNLQNGPEGSWTLYINEIKSKANIDTIVNDCSVKAIAFKYE